MSKIVDKELIKRIPVWYFEKERDINGNYVKSNRFFEEFIPLIADNTIVVFEGDNPSGNAIILDVYDSTDNTKITRSYISKKVIINEDDEEAIAENVIRFEASITRLAYNSYLNAVYQKANNIKNGRFEKKEVILAKLDAEKIKFLPYEDFLERRNTFFIRGFGYTKKEV